jgi:hypothetical protein
MKQNMGKTDRFIRLLVAAVILFLFLNKNISGTLGYVLLGVGVIFLLTSIAGNCPLYSVFGINTCKKNSPVK